MKIHRTAIATILPLIVSYPSPCGGFSASSSSNQQRKGKQDFTAKVVEDAVVKDVTPKVLRRKNKSNNKRTNSKPLNARQRSFSQRDPIISLNMNLDYLAKSGQRDAAKRCEEMLLRIDALHDDGYYEKSPDVVSYNSVINAYAHARSAKDSRSANAKRLMERMKEKNITPNTITWNTLLRCILKEVGDKENNTKNKQQQQSKNAALASHAAEKKVEEAESILLNMEKSGLANTISYNTIISLISKSRVKNSAERAESWLQQMMELYDSTKDEKIQPDLVSFNSVIHAYANTNPRVAGAPQRAKRAEELILQMERLKSSGENDQVKPDVVTYSAVLNAYARAASQQEECVTKAMEILDRMEEMYVAGDKGVQPNKRTYTAVINACARTGRAEVADDILSKMKTSYENGDDTLKPDTICYSSVLDAYAKKGGEDAAYRAEELLREMEDLYNNGDADVKPNTRTYRSVITALGKSRQPRAAEKAEQILKEMEYISSYGAKDLAPNTIVYNCVIDAFAKSRIVSKAYRAELLLESMLEESEKGNTSIRPDTITFNTVINAAARSKTGDAIVRKEAYLIGLNAFKTLHDLDYCKPSSITYVSFLKLLGNLVEDSESRDHMAERVFGLSHSLGLDSDAVKNQLRNVCSHLVCQRILSSCDDDKTVDSESML